MILATGSTGSIRAPRTFDEFLVARAQNAGGPPTAASAVGSSELPCPDRELLPPLADHAPGNLHRQGTDAPRAGIPGSQRSVWGPMTDSICSFS